MTKEEAIKRIKDWNLDNNKIEVLSVIIPELKKSEDERIRNNLIDYFSNCKALQFSEQEIIAWLKKQKEQKSTWSREDMLKMNILIHIVTNQKGSVIFEGLLPEELVDWLKSLKERMQPKPKWSEEDDKIFNKLMKYFDLESRYYFDENDYNEAQDWVKSIKERMQLQPMK